MNACCKVGMLIEEYDLGQAIGGRELEEYLLARWLGRGDYTATGLRPLKDWFNQRLIKQVYTTHGLPVLDSRVESDYQTLMDDAANPALLDDLRTAGIDGEALESDFISTATLYRHFTQCLDASKSDEAQSEPTNWEADKIDYTKGVVEKNVRESLRALDNKGRLPRGAEADIKTEIVVGCPDCSTQVSVERAIERGYICADHADPEAHPSPVE